MASRATCSAVLTLLVVSAVSSPLSGLLYIVVFGAGSTAGMLVLSGLIGLPFVFTSRHAHPARGCRSRVIGGQSTTAT